MTPPRTRVYRHGELKRLFSPRSVAIYGISPNAASIGARTFAHLSEFSGSIHFVNPKYQDIDGRRCVASIADLEQKPDCVIIALPRDLVEGAVLDCAKNGAGGIVIFASGYAETGQAERVALQDRLSAIASEYNIRIAGPNCVGFLNHCLKLGATFTRMEVDLNVPQGPKVGVVSQSGAMGLGLAQAVQRGAALSHLLSTGNSCDVNIADGVAFLAEDPDCKAIACVFEGLRSPEQLMEAGRIAWENDKPLIVCKLGVSSRGEQAALSHTGSLVGSAAAYQAAFDRVGIISVEGIEEMIETASFFAKAPRTPSARGVAILSGSGGALVSAVDNAEKYNLPTPQPADATRRILEQNVPDFGSAKNPCDMTAMGGNNLEVLPNCVGAMMADEQYGVVIYPHLHTGLAAMKRELNIGRLSLERGKPLCIPYIGGWPSGPGSKEVESHPGIAYFRSMDRCMATIAAWHRRHDRKLSGLGTDKDKAGKSSPARTRARSEVAAQLAAASQVISERPAKALLASYGVPGVAEKLVQSASEAKEAANAVGYPVALKVESPAILHKSEQGVVSIGLKNGSDVEEAFSRIMENALRAVSRDEITGVLVQPMVSGVEVVLGARIDPQFGPLVMVGLGGILVELLKDVAIGLAPIAHAEALAMLDSLKGKALLDGFRAFKPVDRQKLADIVVNFSHFVDDHKDAIAEIDVNPLICAGDRIQAVDALIVLRKPAH